MTNTQETLGKWTLASLMRTQIRAPVAHHQDLEATQSPFLSHKTALFPPPPKINKPLGMNSDEKLKFTVRQFQSGSLYIDKKKASLKTSLLDAPSTSEPPPGCETLDSHRQREPRSTAAGSPRAAGRDAEHRTARAALNPHLAPARGCRWAAAAETARTSCLEC